MEIRRRRTLPLSRTWCSAPHYLDGVAHQAAKRRERRIRDKGRRMTCQKIGKRQDVAWKNDWERRRCLI